GTLSAVPAARPSVHPAMRFLRGVAGRAYPRVVGSNRDKSWVAYDTILPLLGSVAFVYVYRALGAPERFTGYVIMGGATVAFWSNVVWMMARSEEHTSELQSRFDLVCRLLLEKKKGLAGQDGVNV